MEQIRIIKEMRGADAGRGRTGRFIRPRFMVWEQVPEHSHPTKGKTSGPSSKRRSGSRSRMRPTFHYLQKESGLWLTAGWGTAGPSPTEFSTHSFGECPSAGVESRLSQILEDTPHPKYSLSAKACAGILRRAERRGKKLPPELEAVLIRQSQKV